MGIGNWGSRVVNDLCFSDKETRRTKIDIIRFRTFEIINWKMIIPLALIPYPAEYFITGIISQFVPPFGADDHYFQSILSGYYIFGFVIFFVSLIVLWFFKTNRLENTRFEITENDRTIITWIKKRIKEENYFKVDRLSEDPVYKHLRLQKAVFPTCLFVAFLSGAAFAVYFYEEIALTEVLRAYITRILYRLLSRWLSYFTCEFLTHEIIIPFIIPSLVAAAIRITVFPFYISPIFREEYPIPGVRRIKRENITGHAFLLYEEVLKNVTVSRVAAAEGARLSDALQIEIEKTLAKEITEEGQAFDAILFFGEVGSRLTEEFVSICSRLRRMFPQSVWFYLRIPKNFISERQHKLILDLVRSTDGSFFEEETAPLFKLNPERERELRVRILERLFAVGEIEWIKSKMGLDTGHIKFFLDTKMFTSLGYGYVTKVPESSEKDYRLLSDLYYVTVEEYIAFDMCYKRAGSAMALVKREVPRHDEVAIHDYDTIKDFLWERYGKFIQVFDVEYLEIEPHEVEETYLERISIAYLDDEGHVITIPKTVEERKKYEENRRLLARLEETKMPNRREEILGETELLQWILAQLNLQKRTLLDELRYRNLMVDDVKEKELLVLLGRIDPEDILKKYMAKTRYEREFLEGVQQGVVLDPSVLYNGAGLEDGLSRLFGDYEKLGIGELYAAPTFLKSRDVEGISMALELHIPDSAERSVCAQRIVNVLETHSEALNTIIERSQDITGKCETYIQELIFHLADAFEVADDHPGLRLLAEQIWLVYSERGYIMGWGTDSSLPEIYQVVERICEKLKVVPFDMTKELKFIVREWPLVEEKVVAIENLYLAQVKLRYKTIEEKRPIIDSIRHFGGEHGGEGGNSGGREE